MKTKLTDDKLERAGQIFPLARALPRSTGTPGSTAGGQASTAGGPASTVGGPAFWRVVLTWPFWYTLAGYSGQPAWAGSEAQVPHCPALRGERAPLELTAGKIKQDRRPSDAVFIFFLVFLFVFVR
jgi:hypothetical protein